MTQKFEIHVDETVLELRAIAPLIWNRWRIDYIKNHPKPLPPSREITIIDKKLATPDADDPYYAIQIQEWEEGMGIALLEFTLVKGVITDPPKAWKSSFSDLFEETQRERKIAWLSELLETDENLEQLQSAVQGINQPTAEGIEEAEKN